MQWYPSHILFMSVLVVALLGIASGYGQDNPPRPPDSTVTMPQLPPGSKELQRPPSGEISDRPQSPLVPQRRQPSSNFILRNLLGRQELSRLITQLSLTEEYSDNFNQVNENPQSEFQTTLTLGTTYRVQSRGRLLALANTLDARYRARQQSWLLGSARLALDLGYDLPRLSLSLNDTFVRDDDLEAASSTGTGRGRTTFWRNSVTPRVQFQLSRLASLELAYTNIFIKVEQGNQNDSVSDRLQARLQQQFTRTLKGGLTSTLTRNDDSRSDPAYEFTLAADATYDMTRRIAWITTTFWSYNNRPPEDTDSLRYGGDIGVQYRLLPDLSFVVAAGFVVFDDETGNPRIFPTWRLGLNGTLEIVPGTRLRFTSEQSIVNTGGEVENTGIIRQQTYNVRLEQDIFRTLRLEFFATAALTDPLEGTSADPSSSNLKEFFWTTGADLLYQLTRTWSLTLQYQHRQRDSSRADAEFVENRVLFSITAGFSAL